MNLQIIIPVYKPDEKLCVLLKKIQEQTIQHIPVLIIDSGMSEAYEAEFQKFNCMVKKIDAQDFNHGKTRQWSTTLCPDADIYIFLTQDAILYDSQAIEFLAKAFDDPTVGCAYGRQVPHKNANLFASHARLFNYGKQSYVRSFADRKICGMKTVFISNSFAAYRKIALEEIGGFPPSAILSEDMYVAAKMLECSWRIAYTAEAKVYHSHNYSILQEFKRYFDIGVFHLNERWIRQTFGEAEGEGKKFVLSEAKYILANNPLRLIEMFFRNAMKLIGYKLGLKENVLSKDLKCKLSMNSKYWK